jgi:hypothetical protein
MWAGPEDDSRECPADVGYDVGHVITGNEARTTAAQMRSTTRRRHPEWAIERRRRGRAAEGEGAPQRVREAPRRARTTPTTRCGRRRSPSITLTHPHSATSSPAQIVAAARPPPHARRKLMIADTLNERRGSSPMAVNSARRTPDNGAPRTTLHDGQGGPRTGPCDDAQGGSSDVTPVELVPIGSNYSLGAGATGNRNGHRGSKPGRPRTTVHECAGQWWVLDTHPIIIPSPRTMKPAICRLLRRGDAT